MPIDQPKKSLNCLKSQLNKMSIFQLACFHVGMDVVDWPPENIEDLAKKYEDHF